MLLSDFGILQEHVDRISYKFILNFNIRTFKESKDLLMQHADGWTDGET
jgi:hypothetical protein